MTTQEKLLAALFEKFAGESETAIAKRCGLSIARFSNYKLGKRDMDVDAVIGCAQVLGWDVRATVAAHEMETAPTARVKALWKAVASTAMTLLILVGASMPRDVKASQINGLQAAEWQQCILCKNLISEAGQSACSHQLVQCPPQCTHLFRIGLDPVAFQTDERRVVVAHGRAA